MRMMVFDVESVGLHGEGFAVGWVVITESGEVVEERRLSCDPAHAAGSDEGRAWVALNVPPLPITSPTPEHLRTAFWEAWRKWASAFMSWSTSPKRSDRTSTRPRRWICEAI